MSRCPGPHLLSCGVCGGTDANLRARAEQAERERDAERESYEILRGEMGSVLRTRAELRDEVERLREALEVAADRLDDLAEVDTFECQVPWDANESPDDRARSTAADLRAALAGEREPPADCQRCRMEPASETLRLCLGCSTVPGVVAPADPDPVAAEREVADAELEQLRLERDDARANARILAHSYRTDNRPPGTVVSAALAYPVEAPDA